MYSVKLGEKTFSLEEKTSILSLLDESEKKKYYVAKVNNRLRELTYELCFDCEVELLDNNYYDSVKVYETSLRFLIAMAYHNVFPNYKVRISYNISRSLLVSIIEPDNVKIDNKIVAKVTNEMNRLIQLDLPFEKKVISKEEARKHYIENNQLDKEAILKYRPEKNCHIYDCNGYENYMYGYMVPSTGYLKDYKMFCYGGQVVVQYPRYEANGKIPVFNGEPQFFKALKESHRWAKICNAELVSKINDHINLETDTDFINMCETKHNDMLALLGETIEKDIDNIRLICIAALQVLVKQHFQIV